MNKLFTKIAGLSLGLAMAIGVGVGLGQQKASEARAATGDTYAKVTSASDISGGDTVIFVNQDGTYACGTTQNTNNRTPVGITLKNNKYTKTDSDNVQEFTVIAGSTSGQFGFHTGSGYIYSASSSKNNLSTNTDGSSKQPTGTSAWTISITNGVASVMNVSNTSYYLAFNGTSYFSQYKSGQSKTTIYKKEASKTLSSIAVKTAPTTTYYAGDKFNPTGLVITATYSDTSTDDITYVDNEDKFTFSPDLNTELNTTNNKVTITYGGKTVDQSIIVNAPRTVTSIELHGEIIKKSYSLGDSWDLTGLELQVNWSVGEPTYVSLEDDSVVYECDPETAASVALKSFELEVLYKDFDETFTVNGITVSNIKVDKITASDLAATGTSYTAFSNVKKNSTAVYLGKTAKDSDGNIQTNNTAGNGIATSKSGGTISSITIEWGKTPSSGRGYNVYGNNTAYTAVGTSGTKIGTLTDTTTSLIITGNYEFVSLQGVGGATYAKSITFAWEPAVPTIKYSDGTTNADLTVVNGSTNSVTFEAKNFSSVSKDLFSNNEQDNSSLAYSVSGTTVTVTVTGLIVGDDAYTISAKGCDNTLTLNVTVQASTTFDSLEITTPTTAVTFNEGDPFAVTGIVVTANFTVGEDPDTVVFSAEDDNLDELKYTVDGEEISLGDELTTTGTFAVVISYTDGVTGTTKSAEPYNITINGYVAHTWTKVTADNAPVDWRGTYLLVYESGSDAYIFNSSLETTDAVSNYVSGTISSNQIVGNKQIDSVAIQIERNTVESASYYHVLLANGNYLVGTASKMNFQKTATANNAATFSFGDDCLVISSNIVRFNASNGQTRFRFYPSTTTTMQNCCLYKMDTTSTIENEVSSFVGGFHTSIGGVCDPTGIGTDIKTLNSSWSSQADAFEALSVDAQGILASTTYIHNAEEPGSTKDIIDRYDYVYSRYSDSLTKGDFMDRSGLSNYQPTGLRSFGRPLFDTNNFNESNSTILIIVVSVIGLSAIGGYFYYRKRKEN